MEKRGCDFFKCWSVETINYSSAIQKLWRKKKNVIPEKWFSRTTRRHVFTNVIYEYALYRTASRTVATEPKFQSDGQDFVSLVAQWITPWASYHQENVVFVLAKVHDIRPVPGSRTNTWWEDRGRWIVLRPVPETTGYEPTIAIVDSGGTQWVAVGVTSIKRETRDCLSFEVYTRTPICSSGREFKTVIEQRVVGEKKIRFLIKPLLFCRFWINGTTHFSILHLLLSYYLVFIWSLLSTRKCISFSNQNQILISRWIKPNEIFII